MKRILLIFTYTLATCFLLVPEALAVDLKLEKVIWNNATGSYIELEPNDFTEDNPFAEANELINGRTVTGTISSTDNDSFIYEITQSGVIQIEYKMDSLSDFKIFLMRMNEDFDGDQSSAAMSVIYTGEGTGRLERHSVGVAGPRYDGEIILAFIGLKHNRYSSRVEEYSIKFDFPEAKSPEPTVPPASFHSGWNYHAWPWVYSAADNDWLYYYCGSNGWAVWRHRDEKWYSFNASTNTWTAN